MKSQRKKRQPARLKRRITRVGEDGARKTPNLPGRANFLLPWSFVQVILGWSRPSKGREKLVRYGAV